MRLKDHLGKLEYFCHISDSGSLKKASEKALVGQPQLTKVVRQLEDVLEKELFIRSKSGMTLTPAGEQLYSYAKKILDTANEADFQINSLSKTPKGSIYLGTYDSIARYFFPDFLKYLNRSAPGLKINLQTGRSQNLFDQMLDKSLDLAVIVNEKLDLKKCENIRIFSDSLAFYQSPPHLHEFKKNLIYFPYQQESSEAKFKSYGFNQFFKCDNLETVKSLTEEGLGVGLLPTRVAHEGVLKGRLALSKIYTAPKDFEKHEISICYPKNTPTPPRVELLISEIKRFLSLWSKI